MRSVGQATSDETDQLGALGFDLMHSDGLGGNELLFLVSRRLHDQTSYIFTSGS